MLKLRQVEQKALFFRELATLVGAGVALGESLGTVAERLRPGRLRFAALQAADATRTGQPLSGVMTDYRDVFSPVETAMVQAAEESGHLDRMLDQIATYLEEEYSLRQMVSRETFYPKVLFGFIIVFPVALRTLLVYFGGGTALQALVTLLGGLLQLGLIAAVAVALWYLVGRLLSSTPHISEAVDTLKLRAPVFGAVVRRLALARFSRGLGALYGAGVSLPQAVDLSAELTGNQALRRPMQQGVVKLQAGESLAQVLAQVPDMDSLALRMLRTGEQTGNIDAMMQRVAQHFEEASRSSLHRMATLILPIAVIVAGIVVLLMLVQAYSGYFAALGLD